MDSYAKQQEIRKPSRISIKPPPEDSQDEKHFEIFKSLHVPNLEKIILSSQSLYTDFLNFAGEIWNKSNEPVAEPERTSSASSSVIYEDPSSKIIILHKMSAIHNSNAGLPFKPKKIRSSKSFAPATSKIPFLMIEDDVQPQVASIVVQSFAEKSRHASIESQACQFSSIANLQSMEYLGKNSVVQKDISFLPGLFDSGYDDNSRYSDRSQSEADQLKDFRNSSNVVKNKDLTCSQADKDCRAKSETNFSGIPDVFEVEKAKTRSKRKEKKLKLDQVLETAPDLQENESKSLDLEEAKSEPASSPGKNTDTSLEPLFRLIPKSILYQIPILTFEEFINSLMNDEIKHEAGRIWTTSCLRQLLSRCLCQSLSNDDLHICEKIISFHLTSYNFQNSLHLILLLSCYKSVTKSDRWPHKEEDWYDIGFNTTDISQELKLNGTISLLNIFFLSSYFPNFYSEMLRVRSYYSFNLYEIIASISEITLAILRKNKLRKLIKANGRALEIIFFFFAGVVIYWFRKLIKCKDYLKIYDSTVKKASNKMNELLKEAWRVYLENQGM